MPLSDYIGEYMIPLIIMLVDSLRKGAPYQLLFAVLLLVGHGIIYRQVIGSRNRRLLREWMEEDRRLSMEDESSSEESCSSSDEGFYDCQSSD